MTFPAPYCDIFWKQGNEPIPLEQMPVTFPPETQKNMRAVKASLETVYIGHSAGVTQIGLNSAGAQVGTLHRVSRDLFKQNTGIGLQH